MSRVHVKCFIAVAALAAAPAFGSGNDEPIQVNTEGLQSHVAEQVRQYAAESERALMQYLWFTRRMHHLWIEDVTKQKAEAIAQAEPAREKRELVIVRTYSNR
jgi:hypothetical protein